jgi:phosphatidylglycerol:prolipoprotein diacylglycerol transferase
MSIPLLSIRIGMDPNLLEIGNFTLTWHGFLTFVAVATAVFLVGRWAKKEGMVTDAVYSVAVWAIIGGIIGTRLLHVIDYWSFYLDNPARIIQIWAGGITIFGAILGGFLGGAGYMLVRNHERFLNLWNKYIRLGKLERAPLPSIGRLADLTTPALLIAMIIGRIGDIINGEHIAKLTSLPWGFIYSHPESPSNLHYGSAPSHPAVVYEMILDAAILLALWPLRDRLRPPGMLFAMYLAAYAIGKFLISFLRLDKEWVIGLREAQFVAIAVLAITIPLLIAKAQFVRPTRETRTRNTRVSND